DLGIHAEFLRQVTQHAPRGRLVGQHVDLAELDAAFVCILQRRDGAHQRGLAGAIRAEQPEHPVRDVQRDVVQRADAVRIGLGKIADGQHRVAPWLPVCSQCADANGALPSATGHCDFRVRPSVHDESGQMRETGRLAAFPESKEADMADVREAKVPDIGDFQGVPVIEVMVKPGDHVEKDQGLVTLESAKATMEVPAPFAGTVKEMKVKVGDEVAEGSVIATIEAEGGETAKPEQSAKSQPAPPSQPSSASGEGSQAVPSPASREEVPKAEGGTKHPPSALRAASPASGGSESTAERHAPPI